MSCCGNKQRQNTTLLRQAQALAEAAGRVVVAVVRGKKVFSTEELQRERMKICGSGKCGWFRGNSTRCDHCKCYLPAKTALLAEKCPLYLW